MRLSMQARSWGVGGAATALLLSARWVWAAAPLAEHEIDRVEIIGNRRTRAETLLELLPRRMPGELSDAELAELERRISDLEIFDKVSVERRERLLEIDVREKWTLVPSVEFASASTLADTYALLGLTEYNTFGTGNQTVFDLFRADRGWGVYVAYNEHPFRRHRWSLGVEGAAATSKVRYSNEEAWSLATYTGDFAFSSPPWLSDHFNVKIGAYYLRDVVSEPLGHSQPTSSQAFGPNLFFIWDAYQWADLTPKGVRGTLWLSAGASLGNRIPQARHLARLELIAARPLARNTVLTARAVGAATTRGDASFGQLIGSIDGVRGLEDGVYRDWLHAFANLELRQGFPLAERWALQGVLFSDAAALRQLDSNGGRGASATALSFGAGARLVPTWLASVVLRLDLARLVLPTQSWFLQLGLAQYF